MILSASSYRSPVIHLSAADLRPSATPGLPDKTPAGEPIHRYWTEALKVGDWKLPKGGVLQVTPEMMRRIELSTRLALSRGVEIPVVTDHIESAATTKGYVGAVKREGDWLHVRHDFIGDDAKSLALKNRVSLGLNPAFKDSFGNQYGWCIQHSALTGRPVIHGQTGFKPAA